jgi:hypothetical protein
MNFTNLFGTLTAILTVISTVAASVLKCEAVGDAAATCSASFLSPVWAGYAAAGFGILTLILKLLRPGGALHSLFGQTAVVNNAGGAGVVTKDQVAQP